MNLFMKHAMAKGCVYRATKVAIVIGTLLALINHFDLVFGGQLTAARICKILLTYLVPYGVSTYSSVMEAISSNRLEEEKFKDRR